MAVTTLDGMPSVSSGMNEPDAAVVYAGQHDDGRHRVEMEGHGKQQRDRRRGAQAGDNPHNGSEKRSQETVEKPR
jgi:hypothetical protein